MERMGTVLKKIAEERVQKLKVIDEIRQLVPEMPSIRLNGTVNYAEFTFDVTGEFLIIKGCGARISLYITDIPVLIDFLQTAIGGDNG